MKIKAIAAINKLGYIGRDGKMMWRSSEDFKHFKKTTMGGMCIVGRTTWENDLGGKPLPGRTFFVVGTGHNTLAEALFQAYEMSKVKEQEVGEDFTFDENRTTLWVIGGSSIYQQMMPFVEELHLSIIDDEQEGDTVLEVGGLRGELIRYEFETNKP